MTKNEIIEVLKSRAKPYEDYSIDDGVKQAMLNLAWRIGAFCRTVL